MVDFLNDVNGEISWICFNFN